MATLSQTQTSLNTPTQSNIPEIMTTEFNNHLDTQLTSLSSAFYTQMRQSNQYLNTVLTTPNTDTTYDDHVNQLQTHMTQKVYPLLAHIKNLQQNYENNSATSQSNFMQSKLLWESTGTSANIDQRI
ncbi:MAG TPA: hypothetical protein EYO58_00150, partial [Flavobacteriales bacterium]|nr:hypothetical protein [Flavobacteriales bacterium]